MNLPFAEQDLDQAWSLIKGAQNITLLAHRNPDGDAISSCAALAGFLKNMGKTTETIYPSKPEFEQSLRPDNEQIARHRMTPDLVISCDTANYERLYYPEAFKRVPLINIDHHLSNAITGTHNFVDGDVSSTCELLYTLLQHWDASVIDAHVASCLLYGMLSDTQVFIIQSTTSRTLRIAADLMDKGAPLFTLVRELISDKNPKIIALWADMLSNITITEDGKSAWSKITRADMDKNNIHPSSLASFINFLSGISGIDVIMLLYETKEGKTKVSLRSKDTDVNALAKKFGGGGHKNASGIMSELSIDELAAKLLAEL